MEGIEIGGLYIVMAAAIIAGLLLLWFMLAELIHFDARAHPARSARIPDAIRFPAQLTRPRAGESKVPAGRASHSRLARSAAR